MGLLLQSGHRNNFLTPKRNIGMEIHQAGKAYLNDMKEMSPHFCGPQEAGFLFLHLLKTTHLVVQLQ